jgi:hypothetical protein
MDFRTIEQVMTVNGFEGNQAPENVTILHTSLR